MSYPDQHRFAMQVAQLSRAWRSELDRRLVGLGLSQARWLVLLHLARFTEMPTQRELAQSVGVEGPTLARLLDGLEAQGLVTRVAVPEDRRAKKIALQPKAIVTAYPVRGLDIGATEMIYELLLEQRDRGAGVLFISEDLDALIKYSDRILVLYRGRVMGILNREEAKLGRIGMMMMGTTPEEVTRYEALSHF